MIDPLSLPGLLIRLVRSSRSSRKISDSVALSYQEPENRVSPALTGIARPAAMITVRSVSRDLQLDMIRVTCFRASKRRAQRILFENAMHSWVGLHTVKMSDKWLRLIHYFQS